MRSDMNTSRQTLCRPLAFRQITAADFSRLAHYIELTDSRTCDYTLGGIVLWADYFDYQLAEADEMLFIRGGREDNLGVTAFSLPLGSGDFNEAVDRLRDYCRDRDINLWFSAIPEDRLHLFAPYGVKVRPLGEQWSDYLYDMASFATLEGSAMKKKRNHVNRFKADNPEARAEEMTSANARLCLQLLARIGNDGSPTGRAEHLAVARMLLHWPDYAPFFRGLVLKDASGAVIGFTVGEVKSDTLHVHVEKSDHSVAGANETLAHLFAEHIHGLFPRVEYINRQDDAGDPGLRAAKESWHPLRLLPKFNVCVPDAGES